MRALLRIIILCILCISLVPISAQNAKKKIYIDPLKMLEDTFSDACVRQTAKANEQPKQKEVPQKEPKTEEDKPVNGKTYTNSIGMEFVLIPAGEFTMGCSPGDNECRNEEKPSHTVKITKPFYMGKYEVTQAQWKAVMGTNPSYFKGCDNCPVEQVTWNDVQELIKKLNARR